MAPNTHVDERVLEGPHSTIHADIRVDPQYTHLVKEYRDVIHAIGGDVEPGIGNTLDIVYGYYADRPQYEKNAFKEFMEKLSLILPKDAVAALSIDFAFVTEKTPELLTRFDKERQNKGAPIKTNHLKNLEDKFTLAGLNYEAHTTISRPMTHGITSSYSLAPIETDDARIVLQGGCKWESENNNGPITTLQIAQMTRILEKLYHHNRALILGISDQQQPER